MSKDTVGTIYCDMDNTLVDFDGGCRKLFGAGWEGFITPQQAATIRQTPNFWTGLGWTASGQDLWQYINKFRPHILTAYAVWDAEHCIRGKYIWIAKHLGNISKNHIHMVKRQDKRQFAQANGTPNVLVDDYSKNITEWASAGGVPILYTGVSDTVKKLHRLGF